MIIKLKAAAITSEIKLRAFIDAPPPWLGDGLVADLFTVARSSDEFHPG